MRNGANFLAQAIASALDQSYQDIEIIVVNDGSEDGGATESIARGFGDRITYISQENKGVAGALNTVLRLMTGVYFSWLSHDDLFEPEKTAVQVSILDRSARGRIVLFSDFSWIDETGAVTGVEKLDHAKIVCHPRRSFYDGLINGCTVLVAREVLMEGGGIEEGFPHTQDYRTWWRLIRRTPFVHVPRPLIRSRQHSRQGSHSCAALEESDDFWCNVLRETSDFESSVVDGSHERFLRRSSDFLRFRSMNHRAAALALQMAENAPETVSVSVILDLGPNAAGATASIESVLAQTRQPQQLVLVGSRNSITPAAHATLEKSGLEIAWRDVGDAAPAARLRAGLFVASGVYIAFLFASDTFERGKIAAQIAIMSVWGGLISHTSYATNHGIVVPAGSFAGKVYPEILGGSPVEASTVMVHRLLWASGCLFAENCEIMGASWIDAIAGRGLIGLDRPLSRLTPRAPSEAARLIEWARAHPRHGLHRLDIWRGEQRLERDGRGDPSLRSVLDGSSRPFEAALLHPVELPSTTATKFAPCSVG